MAGTPQWKVYDEDGVYQAATRDSTLAAVVVAVLGNGTVKVDGRIVWREGSEETIAADSYDEAAEVMEQRRTRFAQRKARHLETSLAAVGRSA